MTWALAVGAVVAVVVIPLLVEEYSSRSEPGSVGEWYALESPRGNCARRYAEDRFRAQFELVICRRSARPFTCWELPVGLNTIKGGYHKIELGRRRFDSACTAALQKLTEAGLRP